MPINPRVRREKLLSAAEGYLELDMAEQALDCLAQISLLPDVADLPADHRIDLLRGLALRQLGRHQEAIEVLERADKLKPDQIDTLMALAWCYKRIDRVDRSIELTEKAYEIDPQQAVLMYNLACYFALSGNKQQALSWLGRALRNDPNCRLMVRDEHDFDSLRHDADFQLLINLSHKSATST